MKKLALTLCLAALTTGAFAQGLVNFLNNTTTLVSAGGNTLPATAGQYLFGLWTAPAGATDYSAFTFSGLYGANQASAGRFSGGANLAVPGWAPGTSRSYYVMGWSANYGQNAPTVAQIIAAGNQWPEGGFAGRSAIGTGVAGGTDALGQGFPVLPLFGGTTGINAGFNLTPVIVPEPSSLALLGLGAAALLIRRRK